MPMAMNEVEPIFLSFFIPVGVSLLVTARRPSEHRSMIVRTEFNPRQYFTLRTTLGDFRCNLQTRECPGRGTSCAVVKLKTESFYMTANCRSSNSTSRIARFHPTPSTLESDLRSRSVCSLLPRPHYNKCSEGVIPDESVLVIRLHSSRHLRLGLPQ